MRKFKQKFEYAQLVELPNKNELKEIAESKNITQADAMAQAIKSKKVITNDFLRYGYSISFFSEPNGNNFFTVYFDDDSKLKVEVK